MWATLKYAKSASALAKLNREISSKLLRGTIDIHIHTAPDVVDRRLDDIEAARQAKRAGMAAIVLKSHHVMTADRAKIASKVVGFPVLGGVALNYSVGGLNAFAVKSAIDFGAKIVWMPTQSAQHRLRQARIGMDAKEETEDQKGITVLANETELVPEMKRILSLIAEKGVCLGTGHLSISEAKILVRQARECGITKIIVQHPQIFFLKYSIEDMKEMAGMGAFLEHDYVICTEFMRPEDRVKPEAIARAIRELGPKNCIMATDSGQKINPTPTSVFRTFISEMLKQGLREDEIRTMTRTNSMKVLGMDRRTTVSNS